MLDHLDQIGQKLLPDSVSLQNKPEMSLYNTLHFWMRFQIKGKVHKKFKKKIQNVSLCMTDAHVC